MKCATLLKRCNALFHGDAFRPIGSHAVHPAFLTIRAISLLVFRYRESTRKRFATLGKWWGMSIGSDLDFLFSEAEITSSCVSVQGSSMGNALVRRMNKGEVVRTAPGLYARAAYWSGLDPASRALHIIQGLCDQRPDRIFCFVSAALVHGLDVSYRLLGNAHIAASRSRRGNGIVYHAAPVSGAGFAGMIRVTSLVQTVFDCIRSLSFPFALAIADSALRKTERSAGDFADEMACCCKGRVGMARALAIMGKADGRAENGGESYARAVMLEHGVMEPDLQIEHWDPIGGGSFRTDFGWHGLPTGDVAGELDGVVKTEDPTMLGFRTIRDALRDERMRESRLTALGLKVARFTFPQVCAVRPLLRILDGFGVPRDASNVTVLPDPFTPARGFLYGKMR